MQRKISPESHQANVHGHPTKSARDLYATSKKFRRAVSNVPRCAIEQFVQQIKTASLDKTCPPEWMQEDCLKKQIAQCRWSNPICSECLRKDVPLKLCKRCLLVSYCSDECREKNWQKWHSRWCLKGDDAQPRNNDPHDMVLSGPFPELAEKLPDVDPEFPQEFLCEFRKKWEVPNVKKDETGTWATTKTKIHVDIHPSAMDRQCQRCGAKNGQVTPTSQACSLSRCSRCELIFYCSTECQKQDWSEHKKVCAQLSQ
jgi:hypothetical protein